MTEKHVEGIINTSRDHATQNSLALTGVVDQLEEVIAELAGETNADAPLLCQLHMIKNACKATAQDLTALADTLDAIS